MVRISRERARAEQFRASAMELLKDPDWLDEGVRHWLEKELRRQSDYLYTENEHAALERIIMASALFDSWDGYSLSELLSAAHHYKRDGEYEDELFFDGLMARNVTKLRLGDMGHLVSFCRNVAGLPLRPLKPAIEKYSATE